MREEKFDELCRLAKKYGAALVIGTESSDLASGAPTRPAPPLGGVPHLQSAATGVLAPVLVLLTAWLLFAGSSRPGGAFQAGAVLAALLINPMGAYAMSRFELPGTYKILLILMATMAFPAMVTMIPLFIMLREMSLLNTRGKVVGGN